MIDKFIQLDTNNADEILQYELYFYKAYAGLEKTQLLRKLWDWDDNNKLLRTRIPYHQQVIFTWLNETEQLLVAMSVNTHAQSLQAETFGFYPMLEETRYCEIMNVMSTEHLHQYAGLSYIKFIRNFCFRNLFAFGYKIAYATCTQRRLRPYQRMGAQLLDQAQIDGEDRFFILWDLQKLVG